MADQGFPGQHTTTTTLTPTGSSVQSNIRCDPDYMLTLSGILKVIQVLLDFGGFLAVTATNGDYMRAEFFDLVSSFALWISGFLLIFYIFHIVEKLHQIPWLKIEMFLCVFFTFFFLIASTMIAGLTSISLLFGLSALLGFCAMVTYGFDAWTKYQAIINGEVAQGEPLTKKMSSTVTSPAY